MPNRDREAAKVCGAAPRPLPVGERLRAAACLASMRLGRRMLPLALPILVGGSALLLGGAALIAKPALAMTVLAVDLKALVTTADQVLYGQVAAVRTVDLRKQGRGVWTEMELSVREVWKGEAKLQGKRFAWRHVGGTTADGLTVAIPGMPAFVVGEETVVVLEKNSDGHVISGGPQGKFTVKTGPQGQRTVVREMPEVHFLTRDAATGQLREAPKQVSIVRSLGEFRAEVLSYAKAATPSNAKPPTALVPAKTVK